ncbi:MAG: hypothetical protein ACLQJR_35525 [Stellaceae bacterium]
MTIGTVTFLLSFGLAAVTLAPVASAGSGTGTTGKIPLQGISSPSVVVTPTVDSTNVDISAGFSSAPTIPGGASVGPGAITALPTETTIPAGTVIVKANSLNGFTMQVQTRNGASIGASTGVMMSREPGNNNVITYTLNLSGQGVPFNNGVAMGMNADGPTPPGGLKVPVTVTVRLSPYLQAGTYSDVLSFVTKGK